MLHNKFQSISLHNNLINATNQVDRAKVFNLNSPQFLRNKGNEGRIQTSNEFAKFMELKNTFITSLITSLQDWKKVIEKPFGRGALSPFNSFTTSKTSLSSKACSTQIASSSLIEWKGRPSKYGRQFSFSVKRYNLPFSAG
jgi:hypothetical protein